MLSTKEIVVTNEPNLLKQQLDSKDTFKVGFQRMIHGEHRGKGFIPEANDRLQFILCN